MAARAWVDWVLSSIGDGVLTADQDGRVTYLNPVAEALTGWSEADAVGQPLERVFHIVNKDTRAPADNPALRAMDEGTVFGLAVHTVLIARDGREIAIDDSGAPILDGDGRVLGAVLVFRDVTEARRADEAQALLAGIVGSSEDAIISKNLNGIILSWNAAAERLFGYEAAEAIGRSITMVIPPERRAEEDLILSRIRAGERVDHFTTVRTTKQGAPVHVSLTISPIRNRSGNIIGASKIVRDVTERVQAEHARAELLERERAAHLLAQELSQAKDEFVATLSHELRSPLNAILGWAQRLNMGGLDDDTRARAAQSIERNARAQAQLLNDLLDIARAITGKLRIESAPVDVGASLDAALESIRPAVEAKSISLDVHVEASDVLVTGDADRLQQVFWNLLSNAVKFTPQHGRIGVSLRRLASGLEIVVQDSGIGIRPEMLTRIFERFIQADADPKQRHGGLGLGLSIVRHLVELHGGTVSAQSPGDGGGSTFVVHLPIRTSPRPVVAGGTSFPASTDGRDALMLDGARVLVVDDEADARDLLAALLSARGAEVHTCASAGEAMAAIAAWRPTVIVSDIGMPGEDGYEFIRQVRRSPLPVRDIPAVALTAYARTSDRVRALDAGFQVHVPKPVDATELTLMIASLSRPARGSRG